MEGHGSTSRNRRASFRRVGTQRSLPALASQKFRILRFFSSNRSQTKGFRILRVTTDWASDSSSHNPLLALKYADRQMATLTIDNMYLAPDAQSAEEQSIRAARSFSNSAIARKDVDAIASLWTAEIHVVGSMSRQISGVEANRRVFIDQFASRPDALYVRDPSTVSVMSSWGVGMETGEWMGQWTDPDGLVQLTGRYMAQWIKIQQDWRIQGEIYVPISCTGGAYCSRHPIAGRLSA